MSDSVSGDSPRGAREVVAAPPDATVDQFGMSRLGRVFAQVLEEIHVAPIDDRGCARIREAHTRTLAEIHHRLPAPLRRELERITGSPVRGKPASIPELRIEHAQVVGWLEGIFEGAQFAAAVTRLA
jgi:hypothetical protein